MNNFFAELKRRNVFRVGIAYAIVAWVLVQAADILLPTFGAPEGFLKGFYILLGLGFPLALFLSWAYEMTPEGVKKTAEVDKSKLITHGTGQRINKLIIGGLVLAVGFLLYDKFSAPTEQRGFEAAAGQASIAVLPFTDLSSAGDQEYFADGISEEILNVLARTKGLQVASRTSSFQFKGGHHDIQAIAGQLGVKTVLEGSIRKEGNTLRITAQLINASDGFHIWSETYNREMTSIFAIQDEIAQNIATQLLGTFGIQALPEKRFAGTGNAEAYNLYLRGNFLRATREVDGLLQAVGVYEEAIALDPDYADAWAGLGKAYVLSAAFGGLDPDYAAAKARRAANTALSLDPENGMAFAVLGLLNLQAYNLKDAKVNLDKALLYRPEDSEVHFWSGIYYTDIGQFNKAITFLEKGVELDPFITTQRGWLMQVYLTVGNLEKARAFLDRAVLEIPSADQEQNAAIFEFAMAVMTGDLETAKTFLAKQNGALKIYNQIILSTLEGREADKKILEEQYRAEMEKGLSRPGEIYTQAYFGDFEEVSRVLAEGPSFATINMQDIMVYISPEVDPRYRAFAIDFRPLLLIRPDIVKAYNDIGIDILKEAGLDE